jgi:hypothetical protein
MEDVWRELLDKGERCRWLKDVRREMLPKGESCWWLKDVRRGMLAKGERCWRAITKWRKDKTANAVFSVMDAACAALTAAAP